MKFFLPALLFVTIVYSAADQSALLFSDDFERSELGDAWKAIISTFTVANGVLKGSQTREDHGAVGGINVNLPDKLVVEFKFQMEGSKAFNAVFDDKNFKGSHAGHICRVAFSPEQIRLGDDKEGVMRNDIFEMRKDPARKAESDKLIMGRGQNIPAKIEQGRWYHVRIAIAGDEMRLSLDDKELGLLKSPGIAHPTKNSFHFTVNGKDALFDEVRVWVTEK